MLCALDLTWPVTAVMAVKVATERTYSGVCRGGQVAAIRVSRRQLGAPPRRKKALTRRAFTQRFLKPPDVVITASGKLDGPRYQKARNAQINASARLDHARRRLCGASMRGAGSVDIGGEADHR